MVEPLTNSLPATSFIGKTYNKHPQWYNQPLRLTKEQKRDPLPVLDDFFECYHLNEVRQTLWEWLTEVLSSQRSIANEPLERSNHIYFYEKIEVVIEAAFIIRKRIHKHRRWKEKRKLNKNAQPSKSQSVKTEEEINLEIAQPTVKKIAYEEILNKPKRLIEFAEEDPMYVIKEVFNPDKEFTSDQLNAWLQIGLTAECITYDYSEQREQLKNFHDDLLMLTDSLFIIYSCM